MVRLKHVSYPWMFSIWEEKEENWGGEVSAQVQGGVWWDTRPLKMSLVEDQQIILRGEEDLWPGTVDG